jgi:putative endonuclease
MTATTYLQRKALGDFGERLAARHLSERGLQILARNYRCEDGELDIIAAAGEVLVGCEVKTRRSLRYGSPLEAVDRLKVDRVHRLTRRWAEENSYPYARIRVDVVTVIKPRRGPAELRHLIEVS